VGANLVRRLLADGYNVRCLVRDDTAALRGFDVECVRGDLTDTASLPPAMEGVEVVFHAAALVSLSRSETDLMRRVNVGGTRAVCEAALAAGVQRLVHVSSIAAYQQEPRHLPLTEERPLVGDDSVSIYARTKADAHREVFGMCERGLNASVVAPTAVVGPHDYKPSRMGRMLRAMAYGRVPVALRAGFDWVDARDVAEAAVACATCGEPGRDYIISGHWATFRTIADIAGKRVSRRVTWLDVPFWTAYAAVPFAALAGRIRKRQPFLTWKALRTVQTQCPNVHSDRARYELGYVPRPLEQTIADTTRWLTEPRTHTDGR